MLDQSICGDRGVQMGTNRYFMLRRMVIFGIFRVHIGKTRMKPKFFSIYWVKKKQNKDKKVQIKRKTSQNITKIRQILASYRMAYRLKNSDFKPFFGIFDEKVSDLWVYVREGIGVYFVVFSSGESVPRGRGVDGLERCQEIIY